MELYRNISDEVMEILKEYSEIIEQVSIDEAFCELTEKVNDFEGAKKFAIQLKNEIKQKVALTCSVGIGPNKMIAKIASDHNKPDGLTVVRTEEVLPFLGPLKITGLFGVGKKTGERMKELGVENIADLSKLSADQLIREFGHAKGIWLKQASQGNDDSPVEGRSGTGQIGRIITLKENTKELNSIYDALDQLSNDIHMKLQARKLRFRSVSFIAISQDFKTHTKSHTLPVSAKDPGTIRTSVHELVKAFLAEHPIALRRVGIRVANLEEEKGQRTLGEF
jgi:DNA polymerase IV (DinB-like DNA polymerase)